MSLSDDRWVHISDVECEQESPKAILIHYENEDIWIPKIAIHEDSEVYEAGTTGTLIVAEYIASDRGLI